MRIKEFGESDLLVTFFTPDKGQLKGVAKGARRSSRRFVNCLDLFSLVNLEYGLKKEGVALHFIHSGKLINAFEGLRTDFSALSVASYMVELTETLFPLNVADRKMFQLLNESFNVLNRKEAINCIPVVFEVKAMALGGYGINFQRCCICGRSYAGEGTAVFNRKRGGISCLKCEQPSKMSPAMEPESLKIMKQILITPFSKLKLSRFSDDVIRELKTMLKLHRECCIGKELKTCKYIE